MHKLLMCGANLVSSARLLLAGMWIIAFFSSHARGHTLGVVALVGAVSDLLDGRIARWTHSADRFGQWLDNTADIIFVLTALSYQAYTGAIPVYLPALVGALFVQYAVDSIVIRGSAVPVKSHLGHWSGILNYLLVIALAWMPAIVLTGPLPRIAARLIALFYVAAMCERALFYRASWHAQPRWVRPVAGE